LKDLLLITPPFTQLNTPYPATAYLKGFLNTKDIENFQMDLGIEVILEMFSSHGLRSIFDYAIDQETVTSHNALRIYSLREDYINTIDDVIRFVSDVRVFEFFDYITLDDGELPIELLISNVNNTHESNPNYGFFKRTFLLENGEVVYNNFSIRQDYKQADVGTPNYDDLLLDLCLLLKASGCIAVSGGLEVASDRLLDLIQKGVTVEQVAQVTRNFTEAGVMVHAYLMYGYPTQTIQETVDSLEMVRQLLEQGVIQSGFWHQFALTAHSPVGLAPADYGIEPHYADITFANNDVAFTDSTGIDHEIFSEGLRKSLFNYMHGICFDYDLQEWFDFEIPRTTIHPDYILDCIEKDIYPEVKSSSKIIWLGNLPTVEYSIEQIKGEEVEVTHMTFHDKRSSTEITMKSTDANWLIEILQDLKIGEGEVMTYGKLKTSYEKVNQDFTLFWYGEEMQALRDIGLLVL